MTQPRRCRIWPSSHSLFLQHENYRTIRYACPEFDPADVIVPGSDDELGHDEHKAKRRRIVSLSKSYLSGNPLFISSAALRGPFDKSARSRIKAELPGCVDTCHSNLESRQPRNVETARTNHVKVADRAEFVPRRRINDDIQDMDQSPFVATPTPAPAHVPEPRYRKRPARSLSAVVLPQNSTRSMKTPIAKANRPVSRSALREPSPLPELVPIHEPDDQPHDVHVSTPAPAPVEDSVHEPTITPVHETKGPGSANRPITKYKIAPQLFKDCTSPAATKEPHRDVFKVDLSEDEHATTALASRSPVRATPAAAASSDQDDKIGIEHAKVLSQKALQKQLAVAERRRSGKLPSLNKFTPAKGRQIDTSPFIYRRVGDKSTLAAQSIDDPPQGTPWASTQAMLEQAHSALIDTIRRTTRPDQISNPRESLPTTRAPSPITPFAAFNRGLSPEDGNDIDGDPGTMAPQPINTQAIYDAYSPFALSTQHQSRGENGARLSDVGAVPAGTSSRHEREKARQSLVHGTFDAQQPTLAAHSELVSHASSKDVNMPKPQDDHDASMADVEADMTAVQNVQASPNQRSSSPRLSRSSTHRTTAYSHQSSTKPVPCPSPGQLHTLLVPASAARAKGTQNSSARSETADRTKTTTFSNAQRSPSIDIDVSLTDLQETVLGSWDVHEAMRRGVEAA